MPCNGGLKPILFMYPFLCIGCIPAPRRRIVPANRAGRNVFPFSGSLWDWRPSERLPEKQTRRQGAECTHALRPLLHIPTWRAAACLMRRGLPENGAFRPYRQVFDNGQAGRRRGRHRRFCRCSRRLRPRRRRGRCGLRPRVAAWCRGGRGRRVWVRAGA